MTRANLASWLPPATPKGFARVSILQADGATVDAEISDGEAAHLVGILAARLAVESSRLRKLVNAPELIDFAQGCVLEAAHQRERYGSDHDAGKTPADWFWLIGYLSQKAMVSQIAGDRDKALHHCIAAGAAMANWHAAILGADNSMRPGIEPPEPSP